MTTDGFVPDNIRQFIFGEFAQAREEALAAIRAAAQDEFHALSTASSAALEASRTEIAQLGQQIEQLAHQAQDHLQQSAEHAQQAALHAVRVARTEASQAISSHGEQVRDSATRALQEQQDRIGRHLDQVTEHTLDSIRTVQSQAVESIETLHSRATDLLQERTETLIAHVQERGENLVRDFVDRADHADFPPEQHGGSNSTPAGQLWRGHASATGARQG